jgi:hypothetical protein
VEFTDEIKSDKTEPISEQKKDDYFFTMLSGKTVKEMISTTKGDFEVKFPKQNDLITIARLSAFMRAGMPAGSFDASGEYEILKCATLDTIIDNGPPWFNKIKKDPDFSWRNMPDANFVDEVYAKALSFRKRVQAKLRGDKEVITAETPEKASGNVSADVGDGVFQGVAASTKRGRSKPS